VEGLEVEHTFDIGEKELQELPQETPQQVFEQTVVSHSVLSHHKDEKRSDPPPRSPNL
jgi:hypothetical protein